MFSHARQSAWLGAADLQTASRDDLDKLKFNVTLLVGIWSIRRPDRSWSVIACDAAEGL
jgi:hypothetical protein